MKFISAQCENFEMTISFMNPTCPGYSDGSITVSQTGANGSVDGEITNSTGQIVLNAGIGTCPNPLLAGWYYIYLVDDMGCELYDSVYLADPDELEVILDVTLPSSLSACDGIAEVDTVLFYGGDFVNLSYFWFPGGPSGTGQIVKSDLCYGDYSLIVNNDVGCSTTLDFTVGNLALEAGDSAGKFTIFPNPSTSEVFFYGVTLVNSEAIIYSSDGKEILRTTTTDQNWIDISTLSKGNYILMIISENSVHSAQFIKG